MCLQISDLPSKYFEFRLSIVVIYAFGAENAASSSNLPIPFVKITRQSQILHLRLPRFIFFLDFSQNSSPDITDFFDKTQKVLC